MASIIDTFHIDWKIIVAQAINFGIVLVVLYFFALKPLGRIMKNREDKIAKGLEDAKANAELLANSKAEYEKAIISGRRESSMIMERGKKEAEQKKEEMIEEGKRQVEVLVQNGKKNLETEKTKIIEDAKKEIANMVVMATEKILQKKSDDSLLNDAVTELQKIKK